MSIFANWGPKYWESGYCVFPVVGKNPIIKRWSEITRDSTTDEEFESWCANYPTANIGLLCGKASNVIAFDFDYEGPDSERIEKIVLSLIPNSPIKKIGRRGWTYFYKYSGNKFKSINRNNCRMVDFLSDGKQTVIPPSIHPDTKQEYKWGTEYNFLNFEKDDLPNFPNDIWEKLQMLSTFDFNSSDNFFGIKSGRHDSVCSFAWAIIEKVKDREELAAKMVEYDKKKHPGSEYFLDKKYWNGKTPLQAAEELSFRIEKTIVKIKLEKGEIWEIGSDYFNTKDFDIETNIKYDSGHFRALEDKNGNIKMIPDYHSMANSLAEHRTFVSSPEANYVYRTGYWQSVSDVELDSIILRLSNGQANPNQYIGFAKQIKARCFKNNFNFESTDGLINLKNGVFNIKNMTLGHHTSKLFFKHKASFGYEPESSCNTFLGVLNNAFNSDQELISLVQDIFGYILLGGYPFLHRAFVFHGTGRNGKSTILDVLKGIIGEENWSSVSMSLLDKPFSAVMLDGKLANIVTEINQGIINSEIFKSIVAGEAITASHKGKDEFKLIPSAKLVFACNELPKFADTTIGLQERLVLIPFDNYIKDEDRDTDLRYKLEKEYSGILNWILIGAKRVWESKTLTKAEKSETLKTEYILDTDQVAAWFSDCVEIKENNDALKKSTSEIYNLYKDWAEVNGYKKISRRPFEMRFAKACKTKSASIKSRDLTFNGATLKGYDCLSFKHIFNKPEKGAFF